MCNLWQVQCQVSRNPVVSEPKASKPKVAGDEPETGEGLPRKKCKITLKETKETKPETEAEAEVKVTVVAELEPTRAESKATVYTAVTFMLMQDNFGNVLTLTGQVAVPATTFFCCCSLNRCWQWTCLRGNQGCAQFCHRDFQEATGLVGHAAIHVLHAQQHKHH